MIIVVMGVSGSGKTTVGSMVAKRLGWRFYDADDFHSPENKAKMAGGTPLTDADREAWLESMRQQIENEIAQSHSAVLACSALKQRYRERLRVNKQVRFVYLRGTLEQIAKRIEKRVNHFMKVNLLKSQFETLEEPADALAVDIDAAPSAIADAICSGLGL